MSYCINPRCAQRHNPDGEANCLNCGTSLQLQGRYRLLRPLRELDEWEPTEVFEIVDQKSDTPETVKVLKILKKPVLLPQFEREAMTLQQLDHPGIPKVEPEAYFSVTVSGTGAGQASDRQLHCLVMESIQGDDLDSWLQTHGPIDEATAIAWLEQLVELLKQLHAAELFHRDIKLSNIMLRSTGQLALIDFGTVRPLSNTYFAKMVGQRDITSVMSPGYTPLEQINGKAVPQSDFYALGRSLVYLLTGQHPLDLPENDNSGQLLWQEKLAQPLSPWFAQLLDDMMAPFPGQRPLNAELLQARLARPSSDLAEIKSDERSPTLMSPKSSPQKRWAIAANLALLLIHLFVASQWFAARQRAIPADSSVAPAARLTYDLSSASVSR